MPSTDNAAAEAGARGGDAAGSVPRGPVLTRPAAKRVVAVIVLSVVGVYGSLIALPVPERLGYLIGQWVFVAIALLAVAACAVAYRASSGLERRFWLATVFAGGLITASQGYFTLYAVLVSPRGPSAPSVATWLDLAAFAVFMVLLATLTRFRHTSAMALTRYVLDELAVSILAATLLGAALVGPWYDAIGIVAGPPRVLAAIYPVIGAHLVIGTFRNIVGRRPGRWQEWEWFVAGGLVSLGVSVVAWPLWYASAERGFAGAWGLVPTEALGLCGILLILGAAVYRSAGRGADWHLAPLPPVDPTAGWAATVVFPAVEIAAIPLFGFLAYRAREVPDAMAMYSFVTMVAVGAVVVRTLLTVVDNGHLLNRSVTDPLTGVHNHRYFHERLSLALSTADRFGEPVSVAVIDADDFAKVNESIGHAEGDGALAALASRIRSTVRGSDVVCRLGGDEFGIVFPGADAAAACDVCERVLVSVRELAASHGATVTISVGVAGYPEHARDRESLLRMADGAQYWAKYHGKDQVVLYDADVVTALDVEARIRGLQDTVHLAAVRSLAAAVDARSPGMEHHSRNVAALAVLFARELGLDNRRAALLEVAALVHDVGKIGIPDRVLNKVGPLTDEEAVIVRDHSVLGERVLRSTRLDDVLAWVRSHHEHWDGTGYPDGLSGEEIPLEARVLALCDAYDSMVSERAYRPALSKSAALQEIDLNLGSRFDPALGEVFLRMAAGRPTL